MAASDEDSDIDLDKVDGDVDNETYSPEKDEATDSPLQAGSKRKRENALDASGRPRAKQLKMIKKPWVPTAKVELVRLKPTKGMESTKLRKSYGKEFAWPPSAGVREIIQNAFDAVVSHNNLTACKVDTVEIHELPSGKKKIRTIRELGDEEDIRWTTTPGAVLQFVFVKKSPLDPSPSSSSAPPRNTPSVDERIEEARENALGWVHFRKGTAADLGDVEFYNAGLEIALTDLDFGGSKKAYDPNTIGQHGDGLKLGINAIFRTVNKDGPPTTISYLSGTHVWRFLYFPYDGRDYRGEAEDDDSLVLYCHRKKLRGNTRIIGVVAQVCNISYKHMKFNDYLFLRPPQKTLQSAKPDITNSTGSILLDELHQGCIFAKGILLSRRTLSNRASLKFGYDFRMDVNISRDRIGLDSDWDVAQMCCTLWICVLNDSEEARNLYLQLFLDTCKKSTKDGETSVDVASYLDILEAPLLFKRKSGRGGRTAAIALWKQLRKNCGETTFFYCTGTELSAKRIIESHLKKKPLEIPRSLYQIFNQEGLILTPEEARVQKFEAFEACNKKIREDYPVTMHWVGALISCHEEMHCFRKPNTFEFKTTPADWIEVASLERPSFKVLLNQHSIDPHVVHRKAEYAGCEEYGSYAEGVEKDGDEVAYSEERCDCSALNVTYLLTQEIPYLPTDSIQSICASRQQLLSAVPRQFHWKPPSASGVDFTFKTATLSTASCNFEILIWHDWRKRTPELCYRDAKVFESRISGADDSEDGIRSGFAKRLKAARRSLSKEEAKQQFGETAIVHYPSKHEFTATSIEYGSKFMIQARSNVGLAIWSPPYFSQVLEQSPTICSIIWRDARTFDVLWEDTLRPKSRRKGRKSYELRLYSNNQRYESFDVPGMTWRHTTESQPTKITIAERRDRIAATMIAEAGIPPNTYRSAPMVLDDLEAFFDDFSNANKEASREEVEDAQKGLDFDATGFADGDSDSNCDANEWGFDMSDFGVGGREVPNTSAQSPIGITHKPLLTIEHKTTPFERLEFQFNSQVQEEIEITSYSLKKGQTILANLSSKSESGKGQRYSALLHIHEIARSKKDGKIYIQASRFIPYDDYFQSWDLIPHIHSEEGADHKWEVILVYSYASGMGTKDDAELFAIDEISEVTAVDLTVDFTRSPPDASSRCCFWAMSSKPIMPTGREFSMRKVSESLLKLHTQDSELPQLQTLSVCDLFCGTGAASYGFSRAGFVPQVGVDNDEHTSAAYQINFPSAIAHREDVLAFSRAVEAKTLRFGDSSPAVVIIDPGPGANGQFNSIPLHVRMTLDGFRPSYMLLIFPKDPAEAEHSIRNLEKLITSRGYSVAYRPLEAADYGAACLHRSTILIAAAPRLDLPNWPHAIHAPASECEPNSKPLPHIGLGTVLRELELRNPRILSWTSPTDIGDFCELVAQECAVSHPVSHHLTGCGPAISRANREGIVADYDAPLDCNRHRDGNVYTWFHPKYTEHPLTVRELARAIGLPDRWRFTGPLRSQYQQVFSAISPILIEAVASEILKVLIGHYPHLQAAPQAAIRLNERPSLTEGSIHSVNPPMDTELQADETLSTIRASFSSLQSSFAFPSSPDFLPLVPDVATPSAPSVPTLAFTPTNAPIHAYDDALSKLLLQLDAVDHIRVREKRKMLAKEIGDAGIELDRMKEIAGQRFVEEKEKGDEKEREEDKGKGEEKGEGKERREEEGEEMERREGKDKGEGEESGTLELMHGVDPEDVPVQELSPEVTPMEVDVQPVSGPRRVDIPLATELNGAPNVATFEPAPAIQTYTPDMIRSLAWSQGSVASLSPRSVAMILGFENPWAD